MNKRIRMRWLALALLPLPGIAADCSTLDSVDRQKTFEADDRLIHECIMRGWEPPVSWRPSEGKSAGIRAPGTTGLSISGRQDPQASPGGKGAKPSVTAGQYNFSLKFPPWKGFPCQLPGGIDICGGGSDTANNDSNPPAGGSANGDSSSGCAIAADSSGTFGETQSISGSAPAPCGGGVGLSNYRLTLNASPAGMVITNNGLHNIWAYRNGGSQFAEMPLNQAMLPTYLCQYPNRTDPARQGRVILQPPIAQMITYPANAAAIALRLLPENPADVPDPFEEPDPEDEPERFLLIPIQNGQPVIPPDCAQANDYYRPLPNLGDAMVIEPPNTTGCEGTPAQCAGTVNSGASTSCEVTTLTPTVSGSPQCDAKMQIVPLDRAQLIYPPNSTVTLAPLANNSIAMAATVAGSRLYLSNETILYMAGPQSFLLPQGGVVKLNGGNQLRMEGPAILNAASRSATLTNGGAVQSSAGAELSAIAPGSSIGIDANLPLVVLPSGTVEMPGGFMVPTQPGPSLRLPVTTQ